MLRFAERDLKLTEAQLKKESRRRTGEGAGEYAERLTKVIADGLAHIHWEQYPVDRFNQRVPFWENYILWAMSVFTPIPEYRRYHFSNPEKSMERGIGICGDASILMSQLLEREGIRSRLITVPGHVLVEALINGAWQTFDPDFGVVLGSPASELAINAGSVANLYKEQGFKYYEAAFIEDALAASPTYWDGVKHFITKKHYFEKFAYVFKWILPLVFLAFGVMVLISLTRASHAISVKAPIRR
ncbi:transglutaminase domain-containing protein [Congregibacter variabilis]|uniref:Transglutaminase domain-containing protein n=1 Tax=Congregibacter variabilis TaxID=3081200 RepID=A0ABZ0I8B0_9GAMM|nr:transglutaminase domain-containing protein [Congregibacter sp. IMCC43200]